MSTWTTPHAEWSDPDEAGWQENRDRRRRRARIILRDAFIVRWRTITAEETGVLARDEYGMPRRFSTVEQAIAAFPARRPSPDERCRLALKALIAAIGHSETISRAYIGEALLAGMNALQAWEEDVEKKSPPA